MRIRVARNPKERLLGLALRSETAHALLIPRCRAVHTWGMRFRLDLYWLGPNRSVVRVDRAVPPWRFRSCRGAVAVLEAPAATR